MKGWDSSSSRPRTEGLLRVFNIMLYSWGSGKCWKRIKFPSID